MFLKKEYCYLISFHMGHRKGKVVEQLTLLFLSTFYLKYKGKTYLLESQIDMFDTSN